MQIYDQAIILTVDRERRVYLDGALAVEGKRIAAVGPRTALEQAYPDVPRIHCQGNILMPGLINTHMHLAQCILRGMADDMPLLPWLTQRIWPVQGGYTPEQYLASARVGMAEMLLSGTTTFVESMTAGHYGMEGLVDAVERSGMRGMLSRIVMQPREGMLLPPSMTEGIDAGFAAALEAKKRYDHSADGRIQIWLGPRWTAMFSQELMARVARYMDEYGFRTTLHYAEEKSDVAAIRAATGLTPAQFLHSSGAARPEMLLVHCTALPQGDEALLAEDGVSVSYCPGSNMKTAMGLNRAWDMLRAGVNVTFGTDAPACDNNSDLFLAMRLGCLLQKHEQRDPTVLSAEQAIEMCTIGAARAIGLDREIGSLEPGKRADFIEVSLRQPRLCPLNNPASAIVYGATGDAVKTVVVDGKTLVREHALLSMDLGQVLEDAHRTAAEMRRKLGISRQDLTRWPLCE